MSERRRAVVDVTLIAAAWLILWFFAPHQITSDGEHRFQALSALFDRGVVAHDKWPLIGSLFVWPLYALGHLVQSPGWWVARYNCLLLGLGAVALWRLLRRAVAPSTLRLFLLLLLTSGMLPHETLDFGAEMFNAVAVAVGFAAWFTGRFTLGAVLLGLGVANMPAAFVGLALAMGRSLVREKRLRAAVPVLLAAATWMAENQLRKGSLLTTGYENESGYRTAMPYSGLPAFSYPAALGVLSLVFSFGKGLLFFTPGIFLPWRRERSAQPAPVRDLWWGWTLYVAGLVAVISRWWAWYGGYAWGPRFLVSASVPAAFVLAARLRSGEASGLVRDLLLLVGVVLSAWAGVNGIAFNLTGQGLCLQNRYALEAFCWYVPEFSVLYTPLWNRPPLSTDQDVMLAFAALVLVWISYPLVARIAAAAAAAVKKSARELLATGWRF